MLITRRSDYAFRICRVLADGRTHNVRQICEIENIPKAFAYKIIRDMEQNGMVGSERGNKGGYFMKMNLDEVTLYDIISTTEKEISIIHCMDDDCERNTDEVPCTIHYELFRIQNGLERELNSKSIAELLGQ